GLALDLEVEQAALEHLQGARFVFYLTAFVLTLHDHAGGQMSDLDGTVRRIDTLTTWSGCSCDVEAQIFLVQHQVDVFCLRHHSHGRGGSLHPALRCRLRAALHTMHTRFDLERGVHGVSRDQCDVFLVAAGVRFAGGEYLHLPAPRLGETRIHAKQVGS